MSKYTPEKRVNPTELDELGLRLSLQRLPDEDLDTYRRRLLLQIRDPALPSIDSYVRTVNRLVGSFEERVFEISLVLDSEDRPIAADPRIEVDSCFLRIWSDYNSDPDTPNLVIDFLNRDNGYWLVDVQAALNALSFISITTLDTSIDWEYLKSSHLRIGNSDNIFDSFMRASQFNAIPKYIKNAYFDDVNRLIHEVTLDEIETRKAEHLAETGEEVHLKDLLKQYEYVIDKDNGYVYTETFGFGAIKGETREFPYYLWWQPVTIYELNDPSIEHLIKENLINDNGVEEKLLLNAYGARIFNNVLQQHPLTWGE